MAPASNQLLGSLLKRTSRSFYLTLRVLPGQIRPQIGLAYLLARTSDTIADTKLVAPEERLEILQAFRARIEGSRKEMLELRNLAQGQSSEAEQELLEQCESALALLRALSTPDQQLIREVLGIIISGQQLDLERFSQASAENLIALQTDEELDDYTYRVAGCVGEFWTRICCAHLYQNQSIDEPWLLAQGVRFGKGLQLVNVLRDLPADLRQGRCYLPAQKLSEAALIPQDLLNPASRSRFDELYRVYLDKAQEHLLAGWSYTNALPRNNARVRLACAWPIMIGVRTLTYLRSGNVLDASRRIKISRSDVWSEVLSSIFYYPWPTAWRRLVKAEQ